MFNKLYVRIWLAVVMAVAVLTLLVAWAWRLAAEPPLRDVFVRNAQGQIIGSGHPRRMHAPEGRRSARESNPEDADDREDATRWPEPRGRYGSGPEFLVRMQDGQTVLLHLPRAPTPSWSRPPFGFFWMLGLVGLAVALATYPIIRKLTRRLETLQNGVEQWGAGDLSLRIPEAGQDEVAFLAKRFNVAAERVETLVKSHESLLASQKSLLANASHELRSPLTRIRMGLELMGPGGAPSAQRQEMARSIGELDQLIDEILLASRLDLRDANDGSALGPSEEVDLIGLAAEECARTGADLDIAPGVSPLLVQGHARLLRRLLRNLLENARRYGQPTRSLDGDADLSPDVQLTLARRAAGSSAVAVVSVEDRGPGVPAELRERIFEPFYRLPGASEREGGVGLGLSLVKTIAERHGGSVRCEARAGGGARFVVELPLD